MSELSSINDENAWLGRSNYSSEPELACDYHEFRMYDAVLNAAQVATAFNASTGPQGLAY